MLVPIAIAMVFAAVWDYRMQRQVISRRERGWHRLRLGATQIGGFAAIWLVLHAMGYGPQGELVHTTTFRLGPISASGWVERPLVSTGVAVIGLSLGVLGSCVASVALVLPRLQRYYTAEAETLLKRAGVSTSAINKPPGAAPSPLGPNTRMDPTGRGR